MVGFGVEIGLSFGYIHESAHKFHKQDVSQIISSHDYTIEAQIQERVHFRLGDALLTEDGRQALRIMAAKELASFVSEGSRLVLNGHADRKDCDERNVQLSDLRAKNTKQALKDILGDQLKIPDERFLTIGHGERRAAQAGDLDNKENRNWRRVEALLNSRLVIRLTGQ
jgi:outer membrane protein OmpA-like peptidoglycan-associated protein